jgi:hypothetical protein
VNVWLRLAFAVWGLAVAISLYSVWDQPAPPGQLPGAAAMLGLDARAPFRFIAGLMLLPIAFSFVGSRIRVTRPWARNTFLIAPLVTLWLATIQRSPLWAIVPCAIVLSLAFVFRDRDLHFTRNDAVLLPALLATFLGLFDALFAHSVDRAAAVAFVLIFVLRVAVALIARELPPAFAFLVAPLGLLLQTSFFARDQRYFGWHALALAVVTPFLLRVTLRNARRARTLLVLLVYPLSLYAYVNATSLQTAEGKPRVNIFEDSHALLPASEYLRGERPYRDILPAHGLIEDGFFDVLALTGRDVSLGATGKARAVVSGLGIVAVYALAAALTGSAEIGLLAGFLTLWMGFFRATIRFIPALIALALMVKRRVRSMRWAALWTVVAGLTSLDYAAYTLCALIVCIGRMGRRVRARAVREAAIGIAIGAVPLFLGLLVFGILGDFLRGTFIEVLSLGPVYTLTMFTLPPALQSMRAFPEVLAGLLHRDTILYLVWPAVAVLVAAFLPVRPRRRLEPFVILGVWIVLTAVSYAERQHLYYMIVTPAMLCGLLLTRWRVPVLIALLVLASPTTHIGVVANVRGARGPLAPDLVTIDDLPRARGALFHRDDADGVTRVGKYLALSLAPDETFFDFSNRGIYYFLFRRDCPIRQYEVPFYETEARQREVIARIENNPKVRAVLLPGPSGRYTIDGVDNRARAPLVWQYLEASFTPDFAEGDVVFWRRK